MWSRFYYFFFDHLPTTYYNVLVTLALAKFNKESTTDSTSANDSSNTNSINDSTTNSTSSRTFSLP
jgi:hypothetical protein